MPRRTTHGPNDSRRLRADGVGGTKISPTLCDSTARSSFLFAREFRGGGTRSSASILQLALQNALATARARTFEDRKSIGAIGHGPPFFLR